MIKNSCWKLSFAKFIQQSLDAIQIFDRTTIDEIMHKSDCNSCYVTRQAHSFYIKQFFSAFTMVHPRILYIPDSIQPKNLINRTV